MTREEILQAISDDKMMPYIQPEQLVQIVAFVINNYRPSLPSDLDEAAEECVKTTSVKVWGKIDPKKDLKGYMARANYGTGLLDGFKAGAEWMAGQGASFNTKVGWIDGPTILDWPDNILDKFEMGDEVIVQIRKNNPAKA